MGSSRFILCSKLGYPAILWLLHNHRFYGKSEIAIWLNFRLRFISAMIYGIHSITNLFPRTPSHIVTSSLLIIIIIIVFAHFRLPGQWIIPVFAQFDKAKNQKNISVKSRRCRVTLSNCHSSFVYFILHCFGRSYYTHVNASCLSCAKAISFHCFWVCENVRWS